MRPETKLKETPVAIPASLQKGLTLPVISSPMFLVSGPDLVVEACNAGIIGTRSEEHTSELQSH